MIVEQMHVISNYNRLFCNDTSGNNNDNTRLKYCVAATNTLNFTAFVSYSLAFIMICSKSRVKGIEFTAAVVRNGFFLSSITIPITIGALHMQGWAQLFMYYCLC